MQLLKHLNNLPTLTPKKAGSNANLSLKSKMEICEL